MANERGRWRALSVLAIVLLLVGESCGGTSDSTVTSSTPTSLTSATTASTPIAPTSATTSSTAAVTASTGVPAAATTSGTVTTTATTGGTQPQLGGIGWRLLGFTSFTTNRPAIVSESIDLVPAEAALGVELSSVALAREMVVVLPVPGRNGCVEYELESVGGHQDFVPNLIEATITPKRIAEFCTLVAYSEAFVIAVDRQYWPGDHITVISIVNGAPYAAGAPYEATIEVGPVAWEPPSLVAVAFPAEGSGGDFVTPSVRLVGPAGVVWDGPLGEELAVDPLERPEPGLWTIQVSVADSDVSCSRVFELSEHHGATVIILTTPDDCTVRVTEHPPRFPAADSDD